MTEIYLIGILVYLGGMVTGAVLVVWMLARSIWMALEGEG